MRGFSNNFTAIGMLINTNKYDIVILTETWLKVSKNCLNYNYLSKDSLSAQEKSNGIRILYKRNINIVKIQEYQP